MSDNAANDTSSDEAVSQFLAVTGSLDANQASSYLEMSGGNLETAVSLYLEHQGGGGAGGGVGGLGGGGGGTSFGDMGGDASYAPVSSGSASGRNSSSNNPTLQPGEVRAPDETRRMRLMDFEDGPPNHGPHDAAMMMGMGGGGMGGMRGMGGMGMMGQGGMIDPRQAMGAFASGAFDDNDRVMNEIITGGGSFRDVLNRAAAADSSQNSNNDDDDDDDDEVQDVTPQNSQNSGNALNDMYAPPRSLMHVGGFQSARSAAKDSKRWLLVSLINDADFACHAMNRDVWRDELVENLVRSGFVFWQERDDRPDGRTYVQRYQVHSYPHVAIIDPRTGRLVWKKEGWTQQNPMTAAMFAESATDFCSRHSLDEPPMPPRAASLNNNNNNNVSNNNSQMSSTTTPSAIPRQMTEEEQLQAAIRASMNDNEDSKSTSDGDDSIIIDSDSDDEIFVDDRKRKADNSDSIDVMDVNDTTILTDENDTAKEPTFEDEIATMAVADEPVGQKGAARIMLRMPDGKRVVRKFSVDSTVKEIYAFIAQSHKDAIEGQSFVLKAGFPPKDLLPSIDETIGNTGLAGDNITVISKN